MKSTGSKFAGFVLVMAMMLAGSGSLWAQADTDAMTDSQPDAKAQTRLTARVNTVINGIRSELRGDYRASASPIRLNAELEQLNLPIGTPVAFCLLQGGVKHLAGVGRVHLKAGVRVAEIQLEASDGDRVPVVKAGDRLQAHQKKIAPFNTPATCGSPLLTSAAFQ